MEESAKEAAYSMICEIMTQLFESDIIGSNIYDVVTDKTLFMKTLEIKYHYIKIINEKLNHE